MSERRLPTWSYRLFRLRWVDHLGGSRWQLGVAYIPSETFSANGAPFRALAITFGPREFVFDLGPAS